LCGRFSLGGNTRLTGVNVPSPYNDLVRIADSATPSDQRALAMQRFAQELDWVPNYEVQGTFGVNSIAGHLIVEHGLENAAAISFLKAPFRSAELGADQLRALLAVSYNNLIEWHLFVSESDARRRTIWLIALHRQRQIGLSL
jgi:hypothetical protein